MGQVVSIPGSDALDRRNGHVLEPVGSRVSATARLIPGGQSLAAQKPESSSATVNGGAVRLTFSLRALAAIAPASLQKVCPSQLGALVMDVGLICTALVAALPFLQTVLNTKTIVLYACALAATAMQEGLYGRDISKHSARTLIGKASAWAWFLTVVLAAHSGRGMAASGLLALGSFCLLSSWRRLFQSLEVPNSSSRRNVLVVGRPSATQRIANAIRSDPSASRCVKAVMPEQQFRWASAKIALGRIAREEHIDEVILAVGDGHLAASIFGDCAENGLDVVIAPEIAGGRALGIEILGGVPLIKLREQVLPEWTLAIKRIMDVALGAIAIMLTLPLMAAMAALVKLDSPGPVLYLAARIGRKGRHFTCYKFRTMAPHAERIKDQLRMTNERHGAFFKMHADPRITRVGQWLRRYSLDELPQLWNVVRGDMSLVGPRPHPPDDVERYALEDLRRLDFTPGMTGLWQVVARNDPSFKRCVALDIAYIRRWSLLLDCRILGGTVAAVLRGSGI